MNAFMKYRVSLLIGLILFIPSVLFAGVSKQIIDICVYGGTSSGVICAYAASLLGKSVVLIEPSNRLGGLSSGGLGQTDIGNKEVISGLSRNFYKSVGKYYGKSEQWTFEPKVAESLFLDYINRAHVKVIYGFRIEKVRTKEHQIQFIVLGNGVGTDSRKVVYAKQFVDCSYEGDLMAKAKVSYTYGRESNLTYGETYNGVQLLDGHQFPDGIDPYKVRGNSQSGLIYGVHNGTLKKQGTGDQKIQSYNFRITLTDIPENRIPIDKPKYYDPSHYELLLRLKEKMPWKSVKDIFIWNMMPHHKTDINNYGGFSTDMIGENWNYPEASYAEREKIKQRHENYTKGLLYFLGHDLHIPKYIRDEMLHWGYPKDEYTDHNHFTPQLYIRESRRMLGEYVMTQRNCQGAVMVSDGIGYATYNMDSHNCDRLVVNGMVKNEGNVEIGGFKPYLISYHSITPKRMEVINLLVPVCLSASHIAYGSIRMEPVFMELGQVAAIAAAIAIDRKIKVQDVKSDLILSIYRKMN